MTIYDPSRPRPDAAPTDDTPTDANEPTQLGAFGAAEPNTIDEPVAIHAGPDDDPPLGPLTLKEAYGEVIAQALAWHPEARVALAVSSTGVDDAFVDLTGACPAWSFSFVAPDGTSTDLDVVNGQVAPGSDPAHTIGEPFALEDSADSPELIDRARAEGLAGDQFVLRLARDANGTLRAVVQSAQNARQVTVDPTL
jgi:hypothetical protein